MANDSLLDTFFEECDELVEALTENLDLVSSGEWDTETINAIFRAVHSIKGAAGAFGFDDLVSFAHHYETTLDQIRAGSLDISEDVLRVIVRSADNLAQLVDCSRDEDVPPPSATAGLIEELKALSGAGGADKSSAEPQAEDTGEEFTFEPLAVMPIAEPEPEEKFISIRFKPKRSLYFSGHDPLKTITALAEYGDLTVECDVDGVPKLEGLDFDEGYLSWLIQLETNEDVETIEDVFEFLKGTCDLTVEIDQTSPAEVPPDLAHPEASIENNQAQTIATEQKPQVKSESPTSSSAASSSTTKAERPEPSKSTAPKQKAQATLRVDPERVDRLINSVGELIINQAVLHRHLSENGMDAGSDVSAALDDYGNLAREIQEGVMAIRSQQVKPLFQRMARVVREAGDMTKKKVKFVTEGDSVEIDKTILERMSDPLTHMLRNAVDHGVENPEIRRQSGKPEQGTVTLSAAHRSGHVVIEISDDGAGLDREKLFQKAIEKGVVQPDAKLSEAETYALLFAPGFSTAENVTNLSGRGVGMDVVKTSITSLGGKVSIASVPGQGSTFTISLPLTLAVLDGMIVNVGKETMVIPLANVIETIRPDGNDIREVGPSEWVLSVRGDYIPIIDLHGLLNLAGTPALTADGTFVLTDTNGSISAISVSEIHDQRQVVIKSLKGNYGEIEGIAAATILGDGKIALIVDPEALPILARRQKLEASQIKMEA